MEGRKRRTEEERERKCERIEREGRERVRKILYDTIKTNKYQRIEIESKTLEEKR